MEINQGFLTHRICARKQETKFPGTYIMSQKTKFPDTYIMCQKTKFPDT
jgi:hypothetical protein